MNQIATVPSKLDEYRIAVLPPERARDLYASLPSHIKPAVFERNLVNALMTNPALMEYDPRLIFREVSKAAGLGLLLDPLLGEGYIVTAYNYKTRATEPQLRVGYKGMCKLARQAGDVTGIYAHEVHALDDVECDLGFPKVFHHKPKLFSDRGDLIGYVALVTFRDGTFDFEPMSRDQCLAIRDRSDAWKAFKDGKIKSTPWSTDEVEMSKKTALRRLMKRQAQSPELVDAIRIEDEAEHPEIRTMPDVPRARVPSPSEVLPPPKEEAPPAEPPPEHMEPFELPTENVGFPAWAQTYVDAVKQAKTLAEVNQWDARNTKALDAINEKNQALYKKIDAAVAAKVKELEPKPEPRTNSGAAAISSGIPKKEAPTGLNVDVDYDGSISFMLDKIHKAISAETLEAFFNEAPIQEQMDKLMPPDREEIVGAYDKKMRTFE